MYSKIRKTYNNQGLSIGEVCGQQLGVNLGSVYKPWGDFHLKGLEMLVVLYKSRIVVSLMVFMTKHHYF